MPRNIFWTRGFTAALLCLAGCQGASGPVTPPSTGSSIAAPTAVPLSADPNVVAVGVADLHIDLTTQTAELTPVRDAAAIGDIYSELGLAPAFTEMFGPNFKVVALRQASSTGVEVDFEIIHPFSPTVRPDLAIFNTKAWFVTDLPPVNAGGIDGAPGLVSNADGYGRLWLDTANVAPGFTTATVQPYVILNEDPTAGTFDFQNPSGYNVLFPGMSSVDTVGLELGGATQLNVRVFITADYGQSAVRATRQTPAYELPKFAGNAPWKIEVTEIDNQLAGGQAASTATYQVDIWDWKHGQSLGSDVASATLSIPGVTTSPLTLSLSGSGQDPTPLTATQLVTNSLSAADGSYWGIVTATDSATGVGLKEDLVTPVPLSSYVTYQWFPVSIATVATPPTAVLMETSCPPSTGYKEGSLTSFDASGSIPGTNPITQYEWDWDYDSITFDVDATGITVARPNPAAGTFTVALRVGDGVGNSDIDTAVVVVVPGTLSWSAPTRVTTNGIWNNDEIQAARHLAITPDGTVHMVYGYRSFGPSFTWTVEHRSLDACNAGTWSAPTEVYSFPSNANYGTVDTEVTPDGLLWVSYWQLSPDQWAAKSFDGTTWSAAQSVTSPIGSESYWLQTGILEQKPDGTLGFLTFTNPLQLGCPGSPAIPAQAIFFERAGSTWGAGSVIGNADIVVNINGCGSWSWLNTSAGLASLPNGDWVAAWNDLASPYTTGPVPSPWSYKVVWNRVTGGTWGTQADLIVTGQTHNNTALVESPNGTLWLTTREGNNGSALRAATYDGTAWSTSQAILPNLGGFYADHDLVFDAGGNGMLIIGTGWTEDIRAKRFNQNDSLATIASNPTEIVGASVSAQRNTVMVVPHGDGRWTASWSSYEFGSAPDRVATTYE